MRWLRWTFRCRRGRRCANLVLDDLTAKRLAEGEEDDAWAPLDNQWVPGGKVVYFDYTCGSCGTCYRGVSVVAIDGSYSATTRESASCLTAATTS